MHDNRYNLSSELLENFQWISWKFGFFLHGKFTIEGFVIKKFHWSINQKSGKHEKHIEDCTIVQMYIVHIVQLYMVAQKFLRLKFHTIQDKWQDKTRQIQIQQLNKQFIRNYLFNVKFEP